MLFRQLRVELGQRAQRLCRFAGMRRIVFRFASQFGFSLFVERCQLFVDLGVVFVLDRVRRVVSGELLMLVGAAVGLRHFLEVLIR